MRERRLLVVLGALTLALFVGFGVASGSPQPKSSPLGSRPQAKSHAVGDGGYRQLPSPYSEIGIKPYGTPGVVSELNLLVWGADSTRRGGDPYSPVHIGNGDPTLNEWHTQMPYGYLYRI